MDPKLTWKLASNAEAGGGWAGPAATPKSFYFLFGCKKHYSGMSVSKTHHEITTFAPKPTKTQ